MATAAFLDEIVARLRDAYPDKPSASQYLLILLLITEEMSMRNARDAVVAAFGLDSSVVINDIYRVRSRDGIVVDPAERARVLARLTDSGVLEAIALSL